MNNYTDLNSDLDALLNSGASAEQVWMLADWLVRDQLPRCLDVAGMEDVSGRLRAAQPITDFTSFVMVSEVVKNAHHKLYADAQKRTLTVARVAADEVVEKATKEMASNFIPIVGEPHSTERNVVMAAFVNHVPSTIRWALWLAAYKAVEGSGQSYAAQSAVQPVVDEVKESGRDLVRRLSSL
jgi:hypothetical protein